MNETAAALAQGLIRRVPPPAKPDGPLGSISIGTNDAIEVCEHPNSGQSLVGSPHFRTIGCGDGQLDDWNGEA